MEMIKTMRLFEAKRCVKQDSLVPINDLYNKNHHKNMNIQYWDII